MNNLLRSLVPLAALTACSAEADVPRIVVTQSNIAIQGLNNPNEVTVTARTTFEHPVGFEIPQVFDAELFPRGATATVSQASVDRGVRSFDFVDEMTVLLGTRSGNLPTKEIAHFVRDQAFEPEANPSLPIPTSDSFNVVEYWAAGDSYYELSLTGRLPDVDWTLDLTAEFTGSLAL